MGPAPGIDVPEVPKKADKPAPPLPPPGSLAKFKRRDQLSAEELRKQLAGAPEIGLERSSLASLVWEHKAQQEEGLSNFGTPNLAPTPLYDVYPGVKGLSMRRGREAQLDSRRAATLDALSRKLRVYVAQLAPADRNGKRAGAAELRAVMYHEMRGRKPEWLRPEAIPVVMQMLTHEDVVLRHLLIEILSEINHPASTAALAQRAICDLDADLRAFAIEQLKRRPSDDYREVLLRALRHPLPMMADHSAEALVALGLRDVVPSLVVMLKEPDPAAPYAGKDGRLLVREVVRTNHLANCLLCHPPSVTYTDPVPGVVPNARWLYPVVSTSPVLVARTAVVNSTVGMVRGRRVPQTVVTPSGPPQPITPSSPSSPASGNTSASGAGASVTSSQAQQVISFVNSRTSQTTSNGSTQQTGCHDYTAFAGLLNNVTVPSTPPTPGKTAAPKNSTNPQSTNASPKSGQVNLPNGVASKGGQPKQTNAVASKGGTPGPAPAAVRTTGGGPRTTTSTRFATVPTRGVGVRQTPIVQTAIVPRTDVTVVNLPLVVRGDVTYLRQDFSVAQEVTDPNDPKTVLHMRFDYLVRTRRATAEEIKTAKEAEPGRTYPQREAVLFALRELTGQDVGPTPDDWQRRYPDAALDSRAERLAAELVRTEGTDRQLILTRFRDGKGPLYTDALAAAIARLTGKERAQTRTVLVERLTRMTAATLRNKLEEESSEIRRAAVLACAQKEDPSHVPDLVQRLDDTDEAVVRAAEEALGALTGKDFATAEQWREWWQKQDAE
jgi:hypothetical protein